MIRNEPGRRVGDFSLGPRVLIDFADLPAAGLLTFGSRARRVLLVKLADEQDRPARDGARDPISRTSSSTRGRTAATDDEIGEDFERAENYLSLVGLVIVILGGIAVSSVTRVFVLQKMRSIAVLKCLGARSGQIIAIYMLQVMTLGLAGSLLGVVLARLAIAADALCARVGHIRDCRIAAGGRGIRRHLERAPDRASASACWCRCCFRSCRCCRCGW